MKKTNFCADWLYNGRTVTLPHDAMLEQGRIPDAPGGSAVGYYKGSVAVYKKTFSRPDAEKVQFLFEGVYRKAEVTINGQKAGGCTYGYTQFLVDAAPYLRDGENEIAVTADNSQLPNSRWYSGTGIYRPVWMLTSGKAHILPNTLRVTTIGIDPPQVKVEVKAEGGEASIALYSRQGCAEKITRNPDGSFAQAEMTSCGLNPAPLLPQGSYPAAIACNLTNGKMPHIEQDGVKDDIPYITCKNGEQILADVTNGTRIGYKYFAFSGPVKLTLWLRGSAEGAFTVQVGEKVVGTIAAAPSEAWQPHSLTLTATGTQALYLIYKGKGRAEMQALAFEEV